MAVLAPPLTITAEELDELLDIFEEALTEVLEPADRDAAAAPRVTGRSAREIVGRDGPIRVDEDGVLWIEGRAAPELAEEFGTPLYVTSEAQIRANVRRLRDAFEARWPRVTLLYATKANANLAIRRVLVDEGVGGDCFGLGELTLSLRAGVAPELLVLNGSNKQPAELRAAVEAGVTINVDDPSELDLVAGLAEQLGRPADVCLRVLPFSYADPATLEPELAEIAADTSHDKWGMDRQTIVERRAQRARVRVASPPRPPSARQPAPPHARGLRARGRPDRDVHRGAARPLRVAARAARLRRRLPARARSRERRSVRQPRRRHARGVRGSRHLDVAHGAGGALARRASPPAGAGSPSRQQRDRPAHPRRRRQAAADGDRRRGSTSTRARTTARASPLQGYYYEIVHATKGRDAGDDGGERRRPDVRGRPPRRAAAARARARATCSRCWTSAATRRCSRPSSTCCRARRPCSSTATTCEVIRRRETLDDLLATQACAGAARVRLLTIGL